MLVKSLQLKEIFVIYLMFRTSLLFTKIAWSEKQALYLQHLASFMNAQDFVA